MNVTKIETPFRTYLEGLKVPSVPGMKGGTLFSADEINYLTHYALSSVYEFKQEDETDRDFYEMFVRWLHEEELGEQYVETYLIIYLRKNQHLSNDELIFLEQNIPNRFAKGRVWLYELNYRMRFRLRIHLIRCVKTKFIRIIPKGIHCTDGKGD